MNSAEVINRFVGLPFRDHGRGPHEYDCWGLVMAVKKELSGVVLPSLDAEYDNALEKQSVAHLVALTVPEINAKRVENPETGDIVVVEFEGMPCHVGVYVKPGLMLHCEGNKGSVLERIRTVALRGRIEGFYRVG